MRLFKPRRLKGALGPIKLPLSATLGLLVASLLVRGMVALLFNRPGYMDAYYYYTVAEGFYRGYGLREPFLWNYLDNPAGIPHPAFTYWMPLPSLLIWLAFASLGVSYRASQVPFVLLSALVPLVSYKIALRLERSGAGIPLLAGLLTIFSGFYLPYWASPDNFAPFALAGSLCLWAMGELMEGRDTTFWAILAGAAAGLAHLARADGFLLLTPLILVAKWGRASSRHRDCLIVLASYTVIMVPWFIRNMFTIGSPLPATGARSIFLTDYDDLFAYGKEISLRSYLAWGWGNIMRSKLWAAWLNFQTVLAVFLLVFLAFPFAAGVWRLRKARFLWPFYFYASTLWLVMTLVFTFPGPRGSLFHSGGALLPFVFAVSAVGLEGLSRWWANRKGLNVQTLWGMNFTAAVALAMLVSGLVLYRSLVVSNWNQRDTVYEEVGGWLEAHAPAGAVVMVVNPPGFYYFSHRPCIAIPNGDVETLLEVAGRYGALYVLLEPDHPKPLELLYRGQLKDERLALRKRFGVALLFEVRSEDEAFLPIRRFFSSPRYRLVN